MVNVKNKYTLPNNWIWTTLEEVLLKLTDGSHNPPEKRDKGIPMLSAQNITNNRITFENVRYISYEDFAYEYERTNIEEGDVLLTIVGSIGRAAFVSETIKQEFAIQRSVALLKSSILLNGKYLMYAIQAPFFQRELESNAKGTAQKGVYLGTLKSFHIPLPPLNEQYRIVEKIEELFSEIEKLEEQLNILLFNIDIYWRILLKNVFEGKLTNHNINKELPEKWELVPIKKIGVVKGGKRLPKGSKYSSISTKHPYIRVTDFKKYSVNINNLKYIDKTVFEKIKKYTISKRDVYISIAGTIGLVGVIPDSLDNSNLTENAAKITDLKNINNHYLSYYLSSDKAQKSIKSQIISTNQPKLALFRIEQIEIPLCPLDEQATIVSELESQYTVLGHIRGVIEEKINQIKKLKQSVLNKAFEGRLVAQNPNDEHASELLKRIKEERIKYSQNKPKDKKVKIKIEKMERTKSVLDLLKEAQKPVSVKEVWQQSKHRDNIDNFYAELKSISDLIEQTKSKTEILLSLKK